MGWQAIPVSLSSSKQASWLQLAAYIAWRNPRVRNLTQYVWIDEPLGKSGSGWQSGLRYRDGRAKRALGSFPHPFWATRTSGSRVRLWGQVRPGGAETVTLERKAGSGWKKIASVKTSGRGYFKRDITARGKGTYRFRYSGGTSSAKSVR